MTWRKNATVRIMTGELAPARHVHSAAIRCWEPGSNLPRGALPIAAPHPGRSDLGDRHIRQNQTRAIWNRGYSEAARTQVKAAMNDEAMTLGITLGIAAMAAHLAQILTF
jgi:hypothetical protein